MLFDLFLFILLGIGSGLLAGFFGVGGGVMIVPLMASFFTLFHFQADLGMHYAVGTSFGIMMFTSMSSTRQHKKFGHIVWPVVMRMLPWVLVGTALGAISTRFLHSNVLSFIFALFLFCIVIYLLFSLKEKPLYVPPAPSKKTNRISSLSIGLCSGLLGIGGGALCVPYFRHAGFSMKNAAGSSAFLTLPIAFCGFCFFLVLGLSQPHLAWSTGYVYWPAVLCVVPLSVIFAGVGARLTNKVSPKKSQRYFALFLFVLAIKMVWLSFRT